MIEQLRNDAARREAERAIESPASTLLSLESGSSRPRTTYVRELAALVESQPEDVAALLRGWLVER